MTCSKCKCEAWKPGDGFYTCFSCGNHYFQDELPVKPTLSPTKMYGNKTQEDRTKQVRSGLADNWDTIVQQRNDGIAWTTIAKDLSLVGCNSSIGRHFKIMMAEINPKAACGRKRRAYINPNPTGKPRSKKQECYA